MTPPTVFHMTHWKAGSQWVAEILKYSAPERFIPYQEHTKPGGLQLTPVISGKVYGTVYMPQQLFDVIIQAHLLPVADDTFNRRTLINWWNFGVSKKRYLPFIVIRDLRDTLISLYFSVKHSHVLSDEKLIEIRETLTAKELEASLLHIVSNPTEGLGLTLATSAQIQHSWLNQPNVLYLHYEDILGHEHEFFERLIDYCEISVSRQQLHAIVEHNIFEKVTGRQRGQEDIHAHLRRGIAGDWQNYFSEPLKQAFKQQYSDVLIKTGYEKDLNW